MWLIKNENVLNRSQKIQKEFWWEILPILLQLRVWKANSDCLAYNEINDEHCSLHICWAKKPYTTSELEEFSQSCWSPQVSTVWELFQIPYSCLNLGVLNFMIFGKAVNYLNVHGHYKSIMQWSNFNQSQSGNFHSHSYT